MQTTTRLMGILLLCGSACAFAQTSPVELRAPDAFASIGNAADRSRALFVEAGKVLQSPRCLNCHPVGERPTQGADMHLHLPMVVRGPDDKGATALRCMTCHQSANYDPSNVPGNPQWHMAPRSMAWQHQTLGQICRQIKDRSRNGNRDDAALLHHMAEDSLVGWGWHPGGGRTPAPGTQAEFGALIGAWLATGGACPV